MNGSIRVSAKTVDDAITEAMIQLGATSDKIEYEVIEKGSPGFLGIGMKQAVIEAWRKPEPEPDIFSLISEEPEKEEVRKEEPVFKKKERTEKKPRKDSSRNFQKSEKTERADKAEHAQKAGKMEKEEEPKRA